MTGCVLPLGLFILLYSTLNEVANGCDPMATPWDRECKSECELGDRTTIHLYRCSIKRLPSRNFQGGNNRLFIKFWNSDISTVSTQAFSGLIASKLGFEHSFTSFAPNTFDNLNVKELHIRYNTKLLSLPSGVFRGVKGIEAIDLGLNKLKSLPGDIFQDLGDLMELNLAGNEISCVHQDLFQPLYSLKRLYMNHSVAVKGLCGRTFRGLAPEVKDYHLDYCVIMCSGDGGDCEGKVKGLKVCNCSSAIGCYTCTGDEKVTENDGTRKTVIPPPPSRLSPTPPPSRLSPTPPPSRLSPTPPSAVLTTPRPKPTSSGIVQEFSSRSVLMPILINTIMTYLETAP